MIRISDRCLSSVFSRVLSGSSSVSASCDGFDFYYCDFDFDFDFGCSYWRLLAGPQTKPRLQRLVLVLKVVQMRPLQQLLMQRRLLPRVHVRPPKSNH